MSQFTGTRRTVGSTGRGPAISTKLVGSTNRRLIYDHTSSPFCPSHHPSLFARDHLTIPSVCTSSYEQSTIASLKSRDAPDRRSQRCHSAKLRGLCVLHEESQRTGEPLEEMCRMFHCAVLQQGVPEVGMAFSQVRPCKVRGIALLIQYADSTGHFAVQVEDPELVPSQSGTCTAIRQSWLYPWRSRSGRSSMNTHSTSSPT